VFNVVACKGSVVGDAMALSMDVDVLAFTGSGGVGRRLMENASKANLKRTYLELCGKSANAVFDDADLGAGVKGAAGAIFANSGQVCVAGSRLLVQRSIRDEFVAELARVSSALKVGDPRDLSNTIGAVNNLKQLEQNLRFVEIAQGEGGSIYSGGQRLHEEAGGYYMEQTIVTNVEAGHSVAQDEVFGPVLAVLPFHDEEDAMHLANSTV